MNRLPRPLRWVFAGIAGLCLAALGLYGFAWWEARQPPIVRRATMALADWPAGTPPLTVLLVSDTHVGKPDMSPERLAGLVDGLNALKPDLVLLAGDYISLKGEKDNRIEAPVAREAATREAVAPLARFRAPLGVVAVLGNHDYWADRSGFTQALEQVGITTLVNDAARRGPFVIGGVDDGFTHRDNVPKTERAMAALGGGPRLILTHAPDVALRLDRPVDALLAGHTHCGQIVLPFLGPIANFARRQAWLPCGQLAERGTPLVVTAGLGTSILPLRFGAPPDVWLIRFGPVADRSRLAAEPPTH